MTVEILQAPVGAGKTETALERLVQAQPLARVWVLVSGRRQEDAFRQRLVELSDKRRVFFNVEFLSFYGLYTRLLNMMQQPTYKLEDAGRYGLLRAILDQHADDLTVYRTIAPTPGFVRVMADFIYELKQNVIPHVQFEAAAQTPKDRDLALIYTKYQEKLIEKDVVDREGEGWLALYMLRMEKYASVSSEIDLLLVDGFDQFTPLQAQLLMLLAHRAHHALITLTTIPGREETVGRRFKQAYEQLLTHMPPDKPRPITTKRLVSPRHLVEQRAPALRHLVDHIFQPHANRQSAGSTVTFIEAPDPAREIAVVLRRVKRLLLETGCQPDDILIALRDWPRYAGHVAVLGREYGLPLALHRGEPVAQNPAIIMLLQLLRLHERDFRRRDLLDVLRSPYFDLAAHGIGREQVDQLEKISRQFFVAGGQKMWLNAIGRAAVPVSDKHDDEHGATSAAVLTYDDAAALAIALDTFFKAVTPPAQASLDAYVSWLDSLIGWDTDEDAEIGTPSGYTLNMPLQIRADSAPGVVERDLAAMSEFKRVLRHLRASQSLLTTLGEGRELTREDFLLQLTTSAGGAAVNQRPSRSGRVLVTTVTDARGLPHQHVFIPGLSEGLFPAPVAEDRIYLDSERLELTRRGIQLSTQAERASDDGLFYELISLAHMSLTLSRPTVQDGSPWLASHLWRESAAVFTDAEPHRLKIGSVESDVAAYSEAFLAVADAFNHMDADAGLYNWLLSDHSTAWGRINTARRIELERGARHLPFDRYSGRLTHPPLIERARAELSPDRLWSASQLNDYGVCGFRFFSKRLLRLDALEDPEDDLDAAKLGTINHEILEKSYGEYSRLGLTYQPDNADQAIAILHDLAEPILRNAPYKLGFRESAQWEQEKVALLRRLESLLRLDFSARSPLLRKFADATDLPRQTIKLEAPFGTDGGTFVQIPIVVDGADEGLRVRGYIDRLDRVGSSVVVIDYKTGTTRIPTSEMSAGRNFQMMVYLHAAQQILAGERVIGGLFWHIRDQQASGDIVLTNDEDREAMEQARQHIGQYIAAGRQGDFTVQANQPTAGRCTRYCEFSQFCRAASTGK